MTFVARNLYTYSNANPFSKSYCAFAIMSEYFANTWLHI